MNRHLRKIANSLFAFHASRMILGGLFVVAGLLKLQNPSSFADTVAAYDYFFVWMINPIALMLPVLEIILGIMMFIPIQVFVRIGAKGILFLNFLFILLLSLSLYQGKNVECGCFGNFYLFGLDESIHLTIARDISFLLVAIFVLRKSYRLN